MAALGSFFGKLAKGLSNNLQGKDAKGGGGRAKSDDQKKTGGGSGFYGSGLTSYHSGGVVRKTGPARLKKGERVLTKTQAKKYRKRMAKG